MVIKTWKSVSPPVEVFFQKHSDIMVAAVAVVGLSPLIMIIVATSFRASMDLANFALWQKLSLAALVLTALGTVFVSTDRLRWPVSKEDYLAATVVLTCVPLAFAAIAYVLRAVWTCEPWVFATQKFRRNP